MIQDVRQRTNMENSQFVTDAEITEYLNQELAELWAKLVQGGGQPHYRSTSSIAVSTGTSLYALPADFWQLQAVEATVNGITANLQPFGPLEHGAQSNTTPWGRFSPVRYRLQAGNIEFLPAAFTFTANLYYSPSCPRLVSGTDTFDGFNGFEVAAIYGACAACQAKEESDFSFYAQQKDRIYRHIDSLAATRDASFPDRVQDVMGSRYDTFQPWWMI